MSGAAEFWETLNFLKISGPNSSTEKYRNFENLGPNKTFID